MYQEQGHLPDRTSVRRDTGTGLRVRGVHGLSVLPDIEAVMQLDHLYRPALRLPCHELRKQPEKGIDVPAEIPAYTLLSRQRPCRAKDRGNHSRTIRRTGKQRSCPIQRIQGSE